MKNLCAQRMSEIETLLLECRGPDLPMSAIIHNTSIYENQPLYRACRERKKLLIEREENKSTIESLTHIIGKTLVFTPESLTMDSLDRGAVSASETTVNQNIVDLTGGAVVSVDAGRSLSLNNGQDGYLAIEDFLDRPVEIATGTIATGAHLSAIYPVWDVVTKHPSVRAKVKNYAFMRANLRVRIAVSGSPFHTGRIMVSYQPHAAKNGNLDAHASNLAVSASYRPMLLNYLSQADGCQVLDVRANVPVEVFCPFISPKPMGRLFNATSTAIAAATSFHDFEDMGSLYVYTINTIGSVSSGTASSVGYSIFAWLEDVELSVPTATQIAITTESMEMDMSKDERVRGPVERISSALANLAGVAMTIPEISLFATPAHIVLNGVSAIAAHYGWSRPHIVTEPTYVKPRVYANASNCIGSETVESLGYDPKRELAVDSLPCASNKDDLTIFNIASRESYLETFTWEASDPAYTPIISYIVHPQQNTYFVDSGATACTIVQPTAMSFAVLPFNYWRGDITFRLDFETSQYHRGKFAIWYEPNHHHESLIAADLALNKNDVQIVDISVTNSIEITVQWASTYPWLKTIGYTAIKALHNPSILLVNLTGSINGHIVMAPFVPLQSPNDSDINVNVFVRAENLLVQEMGGDMPLERELITPESMVMGTISTDPVSRIVLNPSNASVQDITKHYFGEQILSFRACLRRYVTVENTSATSAGTWLRIKYERPIIPPIEPEYNGAAIASPVTPTLISYLRYAFLGLRGSVRYRIRCLEPDQGTPQDSSTIGLQSWSETATSALTFVSTANRLSHSGTVNTISWNMGPIEAELPFYTQNNFVFSFASDLMGGAYEGEMSRTWTKGFEYNHENPGTTSQVCYLCRDFAIGEDFTLMRFQGAPYYSY